MLNTVQHNRAPRCLRLIYGGLLLCILAISGGCAGKIPVTSLPDDIPVTWDGSTDEPFSPQTRKLLDLIDDPVVSALAREALNNNPDLRVTSDRLLAQAALLGVTGSQLWPSIDLGLTAGRGNGGVDSTGKHTSDSNHQVTGSLNWELDVWGKIRDGYRGEQASLAVSRLNYEAARNSLIGRTIQSWVRTVSLANSIRITDERINNLVEIQQRILFRYRDGIGSIDELSTANTRIFRAKADKEEIMESHAQAIRELELLLGRYPDNLLTPGSTYPHIDIPQRYRPGEVLVHRPDVQAALERTQAAAFQLSSAQKAYLPSFVLTGKLFKADTNISDLLNGTLLWDMLISASQPLFNGGRIKSEIDARSWEQQATLKEMRTVVLNAVSEVKRYWGIEQMLGNRETLLESAESESLRSYEYFEKRYLEGLDPISNMLNAKEEQISIQAQINELKAARLINRIDLALALGLGEHDKG